LTRKSKAKQPGFKILEATSKSLAAELKDVKGQLVEKINQVVSSRSGVSEIEKTIAVFN
jgi:hypothetical protein